MYPIDCKSNTIKKVITYKISFDTQLVVRTIKGGLPRKLDNCSVKDTRNWICDMGLLNSVSMKNGEFLASGIYSSKNTCYVSRWKYLWLKRQAKKAT